MASRGGLGFALVVLAVWPAFAEDPAAIGRAAGSAGSPAAIATLAARLSSWADALGPGASPAALTVGADALGALVDRARQVGADASELERLASVARRLDAKVGAARRAREAHAEGDAALEALFRSEDWQRLQYAEVTVGYWGGWAELGRGQQLAVGAARREAMQRAAAALSRSAFEPRLPNLAAASLLGLGMAWRDLGELDRAQKVLERLRAELGDGADSRLAAAATYELAAIALAKGDVTRASLLAAELPEGMLEDEQREAFLRAELEGDLRRGSSDPEALDRAAARLREQVLAGGPSAQVAAALIEQNWDRLRGRDLGPVGVLLTADEQFVAGRHADAAPSYARLLAQPGSVPGLDERAVRYKLAVCLAEQGDREGAASELERILASRGPHAAKAPAARLLHQLVEALARESSGAATAPRVRRAAAWLLELAPDSPSGDLARYRIASAPDARTDLAIRELERIPEGSPVYPASRLELARRRSDRFQHLDREGTDPKRLVAEARALARDLDAVRQLVEIDRLGADPARDATLAVLRAKASLRAGEPAGAVSDWIARAEAQPGLDAEAARALRRVSLGARVAAGDLEGLAASLAAASDDSVRRDWDLWYEALGAASERPGSALVLLPAWERLARLAPADARDAIDLERGRAALRAGQAAEASAAARSLLERDETWGDAWVLYARAASAAGDADEAERA
ncbi:MAG TPA: hypothetical protein VLC53_18840, partial [Myxococcota bacterium]|nr:hypothetical protein [Myxococcota bacterium]